MRHDRTGHRTRPSRPAALAAGLLVCVLLAAQALIGAPAAQAVPTPPKGAWWYTALGVQKAWKVTEGRGVTVAVVDSGVQASLGDLRGQVQPGLDLSGHHPNGMSETRDKGTTAFGHGTDMAALIAGTGKGAGLVGIAPQARILPVVVENAAGELTDANIARGIRWAVGHGAQIINVSLGAVESCDSGEAAAVADAYRHNVIVVASAGDSPGPVSSPADCPGALAIGGVTASAASWSQTPSGPEIAFAGPAANLVNEELDGALFGPDPGNYGTSQAAAVVSGEFALLRARFPDDSARELVTRALYNVHNGLGRGKQGVRVDDKLGYGIILADFAVTNDPPAGAKNPIYDGFARDLDGGAASGSPAPSSAAPGTSAAPGGVTNAPAADSSGSGSSAGTVAVIVLAVVVVLAVVIGIVVARSRRRRPPPGYAPGGFGPPR